MNPTSLYQAVIACMDEADQKHHDDPANNLISMDIAGDDGNWRMFIEVTDEEELRRVVAYAQLPARMPVYNRLKVAELLTRINCRLIVGNFTLDFDDGEVMFKTSLDLADGQLTQAMFLQMHQLNCSIINHYFRQILIGGYGGVEEAEEEVPEGIVLQ